MGEEIQARRFSPSSQLNFDGSLPPLMPLLVSDPQTKFRFLQLIAPGFEWSGSFYHFRARSEEEMATDGASPGETQDYDAEMEVVINLIQALPTSAAPEIEMNVQCDGTIQPSSGHQQRMLDSVPSDAARLSIHYNDPNTGERVR